MRFTRGMIGTAKCACGHCGQHIEFPVELAGSSIACPRCEAATELVPPLECLENVPSTETEAALTIEEIDQAFTGRIWPPSFSLFYQIGLLMVALAMILLPLVYLALIGLAGWATVSWGIYGTFLFQEGRTGRQTLGGLFFYLGPLLVGGMAVFFMIKPLLARRGPPRQHLALNPEVEPVLFRFIHRICATVNAPLPARIDLNCELNASARFRRGMFSFVGNDLVLTIGLPLVAGLNIRQFGGVMAHEFGHFTQGMGMRLTYLIRGVNGWFGRVVYERDAWDLALDEWSEAEEWQVRLVAGMVRLAVGFSRLVLKLMMWSGHGIGCFMLRQMEYDADRCAIKVAGSESFESTAKRFHTLGAALNQAYTKAQFAWGHGRRLPDNFPAFVALQHDAMPIRQRARLEDLAGLRRTGLLDSHPADGDRIREARRASEPGVLDLDGPAARLFSNFDAVARQISLLHYAEDLGLPLERVRLVPVDEMSEFLPPTPDAPVPASNAPSDPHSHE